VHHMYYFNKPIISPVGIKINVIESEEIIMHTLPVLFQLAHKSFKTSGNKTTYLLIILSLDQINHEVTVLCIEDVIARSAIGAHSRKSKLLAILFYVDCITGLNLCL
jgi:hypothetical protein